MTGLVLNSGGLLCCFGLVILTLILIAEAIVAETQNSIDGLSVKLTVQTLCRNVSYLIAVHFGKEKINGKETCSFTDGVIKKENHVFPGEYRLIHLSSSELPLSSGERYCFKWSTMNSTDEEEMEGAFY